jgi:hypothetical protein
MGARPQVDARTVIAAADQMVLGVFSSQFCGIAKVLFASVRSWCEAPTRRRHGSVYDLWRHERSAGD